MGTHTTIDSRRITPGRRFRTPAAAIGVIGLTLTAFAVSVPSAYAATAPGLGVAASFVVLGGSTVTNTGTSVLYGDLGVAPGTEITGFPPGLVEDGEIHANDAVAQGAQADLTNAYNVAAGQPSDFDIVGDLGGQTLVAGAYSAETSAGLTGALTLDGQNDPDAVWLFQIGTTLTTGTDSSVNLINQAQACNVFWQVGSSATLGTSTDFVGTIMALTSISLVTGTTVEGRALAINGAVTLDTNIFTLPGCEDVDPGVDAEADGDADAAVDADATDADATDADSDGATDADAAVDADAADADSDGATDADADGSVDGAVDADGGTDADGSVDGAVDAADADGGTDADAADADSDGATDADADGSVDGAVDAADADGGADADGSVDAGADASDADGSTDGLDAADADADTDASADTDAGADTDVDSGTDADGSADALDAADADADTDASADTDAGADTDVDSGTDADGSADALDAADADAGTDANADADTDGNVDTDANTDADASADTDADADAGTGGPGTGTGVDGSTAWNDATGDRMLPATGGSQALWMVPLGALLLTAGAFLVLKRRTRTAR